MDNESVFDTNNVLRNRIKDLSNKDKLEVVLNLCDIILDERSDGAFRGGIRPDNIFVNEDLEVALGQGGANDRANWTPEELEFMSSEQFWNQNLDNKTDIYSIGLLMYFCITGGKLPFQPEKEELDANDHAEMLRRRMSGEEFEMPESAGEKLGSIIKKATAFRAEDRYEGLLELQDDICECLEEIKSIPVPDSEVIFNKSEDELTDAERMMLGIIGKSAADEALYNSGIVDIPAKEENAETSEENTSEDTSENTVEEPVEEIAEEVSEQENVEAEVIEPVEDTEEAEATVETVDETENEEVIEETEHSDEETSDDEEPTVEETVPEQENESEDTESEKKPEKIESSVDLAVAEAVAAAGAKSDNTEPKKKDKKRTTATPVVQYNTDGKKKKKQKRRNSRRAVFVCLLLCVAVVVGALVFNSIGNGDKMVIDSSSKPQQSGEIDNTLESPKPAQESPEVSEPVESEEPTPTPTPTPVVKESTYEVILSDKSWTQAEADAESKGGHLVVINDQDEFDKVVALAVSKGARFVWLGCQRDASGQLKWVNGDSVDFYKWAANEPSVTDRDGTAENYVLLWNSKANLSGNWEYNDVANDPVSIYPKGYSGKICYVIEYEK